MSLRCASVVSPTASYIRVSGLYTRSTRRGSVFTADGVRMRASVHPSSHPLSPVERGQLTVTGKGRPEAGTHLDEPRLFMVTGARTLGPTGESKNTAFARSPCACVSGPRAGHGLGAYCNSAQDASINVCPATAAAGAEEATSGHNART